MPEVNSLVLNVKSDSVKTASGNLDQFTHSAKGAEKATEQYVDATGRLRDSKGRYVKTATVATTATKGATVATRSQTVATNALGVSLKAMLGPLLAVLGPTLLLKKAFSSTVELQNFQAQLKTATGSVDNAAIAFDALEGFASETPYALEQSLEAFIKLTNLGLTPSEEALQSYGNTASAMGKDLTQLIEAVADATTGEFERLKEFGIKSSSEGDRVSFTFRGMTTTVGKNAAEIEGYLMKLGQNEFAGAMADRMATVGGQVSNLGDLWNQLFRTISEMGVGNVISDAMQVGIDALSGLISMLESGEFEAGLESWTAAFEGWANDFDATLEFITNLLGLSSDEWGEEGSSAWETIVGVLKLVPATVRRIIQQMGIEIGSIVLYGEAAGKGILEAMKAWFMALLDTAKNFGKAIGQALNPFDDTSFLESFERGLRQQAKITEEVAGKIAAAYTEAERSIDATRQARLETIGEVQEEYEQTATKIYETTQRSKELRAAYEAEAEAKKKTREAGEAPDVLGGFKIQPTATGATEGGAVPAADAASQREFEKLIEDLKTEEQIIEESYSRRLEIIRENTEEGATLRTELELRAAEERNEALTAIDSAKYSAGLSMAEGYFGGIGKLAASNNKELAGLGKAGLEAQKGMSIAQTTMKTYEGAMSAYSSLAGIPYIGPALGAAAAAAVVAMGASNIATISSQSTNVGSYATGGIVPGASFIGDQMTASVNSGEMILNQGQQTQLFNIANGQGGQGGGVSVVIHNHTGQQVQQKRTRTSEGEMIEIIVGEAEKRIASSIQTGDGDVPRALENSYQGIRRGAA